MSKTDRCKFLGRVPSAKIEGNLDATCGATSDGDCPHLRSNKRQVSPGCFKIKTSETVKKAVPAAQ